MKILIPMAGEGRRFKEKGYTFPKPLINVNGQAMISLVLETLPPADEYIFLCRNEHIKQYNLEDMLRTETDGKACLIAVDQLTEGAACTALLARDLINNKEELLIANSDQYCEYSLRNFNMLRDWACPQGIIFTFSNTHSKWSYVKLGKWGKIVEVAEKRVISNMATVGIYYFQKGENFVWAAEEMIRKDIRTNGEFYIAPCYNELITQRKIILPFEVSKMAGLGTPEDLEIFLG